MSYKFKGQIVIINGVKQCITPGPLPSSPENGYFAIDENDGYLKVYNETLAKWIILREQKNKFNAQFQLIDDLNYDEYIYSFTDTTELTQERSGDNSNGYRYSSSAPIICPFNGKIKKGTFAIKGIAVSTGSSASNVTVNLELWSVGFQNQGTKLGDINIDVDSGTYTIGNWWNASIDTNFKGTESYNINVSEGDLLAVKFNRQQNNSNAVAIKNLTVSLEIEED